MSGCFPQSRESHRFSGHPPGRNIAAAANQGYFCLYKHLADVGSGTTVCTRPAILSDMSLRELNHNALFTRGIPVSCLWACYGGN